MELFGLYNELRIFKNYDKIKERIKSNKKLTRIFNNVLFDNKGRYNNVDRQNIYKSLF